MKNRSVPSSEIASCPSRILSASHYIPRHKTEECTPTKQPKILPLSELGKNEWSVLYRGKCDACGAIVAATFATTPQRADEPPKVPPPTITIGHGCATPPPEVTLVYSGPTEVRRKEKR